ncbi:mariner transposase [Senna tora]|uniref:Mariner transposase n=1 Tax=Senna tora TaxID=362788 RepID=A0A834WVR8_9FABA|nr:mariner transposase [Senna tora]
MIAISVSDQYPNVVLVNDAIKSMQGRDWDVGCIFSFRESIKVADYLAKLSHSTSDKSCIFINPLGVSDQHPNVALVNDAIKSMQGRDWDVGCMFSFRESIKVANYLAKLRHNTSDKSCIFINPLDLNATPVDCFDDEDGEQGNPHLPISVVNLVPDLNMSSNFEEFEFDLNNESFEQDEVLIEVEEEAEEMTSQPISNVVINENENEGEIHVKKLQMMNNEERKAAYNMLLQKSRNGRLPKGVTLEVASLFSVCDSTIQRIWYRRNHNNVIVDVSHKKGNCGRKRVQVDLDEICDIPLNQRSTLHSLAYALKISKATTYRLLNSGVIRRHSNAIKPLLKEGNMKSRIEFCLSMLEPCSIPHDPIFIGMYNIIHIDEKWFYMTKRSRNYYMLVDEEDPIRSCKSKNFIDKVMFLVALARPRFDAQGRELFSGKIGIFPLVTYEPAKRTSFNRVAGTLETKPIASVNKEVIRSFLIQKFCRVASKDGFDIRLMCQPPNSPDMNVLDLGFFSAIQSLQYKESPKTIDELIGVVVKAFEDYPTIKSNCIFF